MHEMAFAEQILQVVNTQTAKVQAKQVLSLTLQIGKYSGIEPRSLEFCLEAISTNTILENGIIHLNECEQEIECPQCGTIPVEAEETLCPLCGSKGESRLPTGIYIQEIECDV